MKKVFDVISRLAKVNTPVLIRGESGTGKELVAKAIHYNGPRKDNKFVAVNCGAISENLIESELFGHEKGAFTGADQRKIGKFQFAEGGTLFLDEIGDISAQMQVKLLRVLQEKKFTPVGSNREISMDVRIIAASHKPFEQMIKEGTFREDLFYRLNVLPVYLPPLRERQSDVPHLVNYYVDYFNNIHALDVKGFVPEAMELLKTYAWPGNIRELRNTIEHCFIMESADHISLDSLPSIIRTGKNQAVVDESSREDAIIDFKGIQNSVLDKDSDAATESQYQFTFAKKEDGEIVMDFQVAKDKFENEFIVQALKLNHGKINRTALNANIPKKTLLRKIEKYEINPKDYYQ
jgi:DNA-binding NtrC family response regulator